MLNNKLKHISSCIGFALLLVMSLDRLCFAEPVLVEGVVSDEMSKQAILNKLYSVYGADQVVDKIQVRRVTVPHGWTESVTRMISPDLKKISQGKLDVNGTSVLLMGKISHPSEIAASNALFQSLVTPPYRLTTQFSANQAEQKVVDDALKNRIIEFESGSAILAVSGTQILDEMVVAMNQVQGKNIKIIGHTDSTGDAKHNMQLSLQRAEAVKNYLMGKNIAAARLTTVGLGSEKPVADNNTADGRKKNRRIEFEVL